MPRLKLVIANKVVEYHDLKDRTLIGRSRTADVLLADPSVSREHALIVREGGSWVVSDLGSANGITVNRQKVTRSNLVEGDILSVGDAVLVFTHEQLGVAPDREVEVTSADPIPEGSEWEAARDVAFKVRAAPDVVESLGEKVRRLVRRSCLGEEEAQYLHMAVLEALSNALRHGSQGAADTRFSLRLARLENRVVCRVQDEGPGFDFRKALEIGRRGDAIRAARDRYQAGGVGGLGIMLMVKCVDLVEFNEKGNEVTLTKCPGDVFRTATIYGGLGFTPEELPTPRSR